MTLEQLARQGRRTSSMTTAATITSKMSEIRKESIKQAFSDFENIRYRYEFVETIDGVSYYDDSAACTVEASWFTFDNLNLPVVWITYGDNPDCDDLIPQVRKYVKAIICIGENNKKFHEVYDNLMNSNIIDCHSVKEALALANKITHSGDNVVFSPSRPANNEFASYSERGDYYKNCVCSLKSI